MSAERGFVPLTVESLSIIPRLDGDTLRIAMSGAVEMRDPGDALNPYWTLIDEEARRRNVKVVELDVQDLNFMNSSGILTLVRWITRCKSHARLLSSRVALRPQRDLAARFDPDAGEARSERRRTGGDRCLTLNAGRVTTWFATPVAPASGPSTGSAASADGAILRICRACKATTAADVVDARERRPHERRHVPDVRRARGAMGQGTLIKSVRREHSTRLNTLAVETMLAPGTIFARRYRIQRFLGSGAMGYVCCAIDESIDEVVALKVLSLPIHEDPDAYDRFKTELKLARRIRHRNVVQSFDLGFAEGYPFISMEYIDADNLLKHLTRRTTFDEQSALAIMRQVLRGLRAAHDLGIVHRDIKPENILLNKDRMAFITDFGVATSQDIVRKSWPARPTTWRPSSFVASRSSRRRTSIHAASCSTAC